MTGEELAAQLTTRTRLDWRFDGEPKTVHATTPSTLTIHVGRAGHPYVESESMGPLTYVVLADAERVAAGVATDLADLVEELEVWTRG